VTRLPKRSYRELELALLITGCLAAVKVEISSRREKAGNLAEVSRKEGIANDSE